MSAGAIGLAAFLQLATTCGDGIAPLTLKAIVMRENISVDAFAINVNGPGGGTVRGIKTKAQAIAKARELIRTGRDFDAGVAQINVRNWKWLGLTEATVFDACANVGAQAFLLKSYSKYNTGSPTRGFDNGYVSAVADNERKARDLARQAPASPAPAAASPNACPKGPRWDAWGKARNAARCRMVASARIVTATADQGEYP